MTDQPTARRIANARRVLQAAGWTVIPPVQVRKSVMLDQCEYPDRLGDPGDTCTHSAARQRMTRHGSMWLCGDHFDAPLKELFDERVQGENSNRR